MEPNSFGVTRGEQPLVCNGDDRCLRQKQGGAVGAAACRMRVPPKARSRRREPQSELIEFTKHSLSAPRMEKGSATSITQVLAQYNKKALPELLLQGGFLPAKTPADRGKSVNGGRGDVIFRWELPQSEPDGSASSLKEGARVPLSEGATCAADWGS